MRGGSCIVPITAVCGHIPTIKTQKEKKEEKKKNPPRNHSLHLIPERTGSLLFGQMPHEKLERVLLHTLLLMAGQPGVSLKPRVSGVNACSEISSLVDL